ncbi:hypothetical protein [Prescottella soli]|uniref:Uncharacterized protein n=1 Tax=Prescottella soli TaxID=1543852 RepID=A0ABW9G034_9NOCA
MWTSVQLFVEMSRFERISTAVSVARVFRTAHRRNQLRRTAAALGVGAIACASAAVPGSLAGAASAEASGTTDVTFTVAGEEGPLELTVPTSAPVVWVNGQNEFGAPMAVSAVRDRRRGIGRSVTVSASISDFTHGAETIPRSGVTYTAGAETMGFRSTGPQTLETTKPVVGIASNSRPDVTFQWTPSLRVDASDGVTIGDYSAILTHSAV